MEEEYMLSLEDKFKVLEKLEIPQNFLPDLEIRLYAEYDRWGHELVNSKIQEYLEKIEQLEESEYEMASCTEFSVIKTKNVEMDFRGASMRIKSQLNKWKNLLSQTVGYNGSYGRSGGNTRVVRC